MRSLSDVKPIYTASLTISDEAGPLQVRKSWRQDDDGGFFEDSGAAWSRLDKGETTPKALMETCVIDLEDGLTWQFEMQATSPVPAHTLPEVLQNLGIYYFNIDKEAERKAQKDLIWCEFEKPILVPRKQALELRVTWPFGITGTDYILELTRTQMVKYGADKEAIIFETRRGVNVFHEKWEANLASNTNLETGKGATWRADLDSWFPSDSHSSKKGEGLVFILDKLFSVQNIIRGKNVVS